MILLAFIAGCAIGLPVPQLFIPCLWLIYLLWQYPIKPVILLCLLGLAITLCHQWIVSPKGLPNQNTHRHVHLKGEIIRIPKQHLDKLSIDMRVYQYNDLKVNSLMRLTCYKHCPQINIGDFVSVDATIKKAHDFRNPGSFSFQKWAWANHIDRIGSFQPKSYRLIRQNYRFGKSRFWLYQQIQKLNLDTDAKALLSALTIGFSDSIRPELWKQFQHTGTAHLMVISGAHVGLITGLCFIFISYIWRLIPYVSLYFPAQRFASIMAIGAALIYSLLAGFAIPAQRSVIMSAVILSRHMTSYYITSWQAWIIALSICVGIEPHSLMMPGLYLSFLAVAILMIISQRFRNNKYINMAVLQLGCLIGLMPLTLYLFHYQANNGFLANLICIPYVSFILLPFSLVKLILIPFGLGGMGDWLFNQLVKGIIVLLTFFNNFSWLNWNFALQSIWQVLVIFTGLLVLIYFPNRRFFVPSIILLVAAFFPKQIKPPLNQAVIHVLDVGQGLSVLVSTNHHHLLYDTGLKFYGSGSDIGERVIVPFLRYSAIKHLDKIVISHTDIDHSGGFKSVKRAYPNASLISDSPKYYKQGKNCHSYPRWIWDGITFEFLSLSYFKGQKNNHSCVLRISSHTNSILLTGDIEEGAEKYLINNYSSKLRSNILLVPHHGSKTSSSKRFLETVTPSIAIISYGLDNSYHFPHAIVINRLIQQGVQIKNTAFNGYIELTI